MDHIQTIRRGFTSCGDNVLVDGVTLSDVWDARKTMDEV
jgi:hypothetical protein